MPADVDRARDAADAVVRRHPGLSLLVLFGSRARDDARPDSDWDFGYLAEDTVDSLVLRADLVEALGTDSIDLADLGGASALLRYRAARDGVALFECRPDTFAAFWLDAVRFWCDVAPLVRRGYEAVLADLPA